MLMMYITGKTTCLEISETYFILSCLPPDTEFTFQVSIAVRLCHVELCCNTLK